jgi:hypothetical protein
MGTGMGESSPDSPLGEKKRSGVGIGADHGCVEMARTTVMVMRRAMVTGTETLRATATL